MQQQNKEDNYIKGMLAGGKYIFRYFYKISSIQIKKYGHEKINHYFAIRLPSIYMSLLLLL